MATETVVTQQTAHQACADCLAMARAHYENFPVASRLLPARLRTPVAVIYAFARTADDIADEGDLSEAERLQQLSTYKDDLKASARGTPPNKTVFIALSHIMHQFKLPLALLMDLLHAFRMDVTRHRFANFPDLMDYCRYSANPIGRLLLHLNGIIDKPQLSQSDAICSALQLINFYQDISQDYRENDRIYLPQDEMQALGVEERHIAEAVSDEAMRTLMQKQYARCRQLMLSGAPLAWTVKGRLGLELRLTVLAGLRVLDRLEAQQTDLFSRPRLVSCDYLWIIRHMIQRPSPAQ